MERPLRRNFSRLLISGFFFQLLLLGRLRNARGQQCSSSQFDWPSQQCTLPCPTTSSSCTQAANSDVVSLAGTSYCCLCVISADGQSQYRLCPGSLTNPPQNTEPVGSTAECYGCADRDHSGLLAARDHDSERHCHNDADCACLNHDVRQDIAVGLDHLVGWRLAAFLVVDCPSCRSEFSYLQVDVAANPVVPPSNQTGAAGGANTSAANSNVSARYDQSNANPPMEEQMKGSHMMGNERDSMKAQVRSSQGSVSGGLQYSDNLFNRRSKEQGLVDQTRRSDASSALNWYFRTSFLPDLSKSPPVFDYSVRSKCLVLPLLP